ncbi:MAG: SpoIIE family protein phosphatase [Eubacteriales bacterium]|nr:SpoIIE family protein phosphatase [Eubacteriales bacterium]
MQDRLERVGIHVIAFLVARCQLLFMCPFVVPFFMATYLQKQSGIAMYIIVLLGVFSRIGLVGMVRYGSILLFLIGVLELTDRKKLFTNRVQLALASGVVLWAVTVPYQYIVTKDDRCILYACLESVIVFCATLIFEQGICGLQIWKVRACTMKEMLGLFSVFLVGIFGCSAKTMPFDFLITFMVATMLFRLLSRKMAKYTRKTAQEQIAATDEMMVRKIVGNRVYDFGQVFLSMKKMLELHEEERDDIELGGLSNMYISGDGLSLLNAVESQSNRLQEMRKNFIKQLGRVGEAIVSFPDEMVEPIEGRMMFEQAIVRQLARFGVTVLRVMAFQNADGRICVYMNCYAKKKHMVTGKDLAGKVGEVFDRSMVCVGAGDLLVGREGKFLTFMEQGKYMLTTGVMRKEKNGEGMCGDNFSISKLDTQKAVFMLSDGMGSGERAYWESEQVVDLLEQLLLAGFGRELAIELLNSFISFLEDGNVSSTLDLTMVDLYTGVADFIKLGASTTFIKHGTQVECIRSTSLPMGVLEQVEFDTCSRLLYHGDIIVMVSDGILDCILVEDRDAYLADLISKIDTHNAQGFAERMMECLEQIQMQPRKDDSTILVAALWEK